MANAPMQPLRKQPVRVAPTTPPTSATATTLILVVVVVALHFGRDILIPFALSVLLSFALAPITTRLRRWGLGRVPSVIAVVVLVFLVVIGFSALVANQVIHLADNLPRYEYNLRAKIRALGDAAPTGGVFERATQMVRDVGKEIEEVTGREAEETPSPAAPAEPADEAEEEREPIPVEVREPAPGPLQALWLFAGPLIGPLATAGLVVVFVIFILLQREDLRDRLIRLFGSGDVHRTTEAMNDAAERISRYLFMHLVINLLYGIPVAVGLYFIGVPNPLLWGLLATMLRFIPYAGPAIAMVAPIALSFAVDPGWTMPLLTIALFVTLELFSNNVLEPWLYGSSTGLSPVAIIVAAVFWTMLWGPIGLLLSMPLTVCLVVLGRHVPQLRFLEVLLGSDPVLEADVKFYQRMLAGDPVEATEMAEEFLEERPLEELYDGVIVPALAFAEQDRLRGALERDRQVVIAQDTMGVIEELRADDEELAAGDPAARAADEAPPPARPVTVLSVGARNSLDEAAAAMLAHLLARRGLTARVLPCETVSGGNLPRLERGGVALVCLSYVNPKALQHARRVVRRLRQHFPDGVPILVGLWHAEPAEGDPRDALAATGADLLATSLSDAAEQVLGALAPTDGAPADAARAAVAEDDAPEPSPRAAAAAGGVT
ncbi:MAG TPA: AI-2E family transporter [Geminicoccaceae bacterium]|nr:AI-2E family transporter [Geminicoccaceae bacterium]